MAVSRVKSSSVLQGFPKYRSMLAGNAGYDPAATWLIQRVAGTGSSITFSSIPQTYSSLQIRAISRTNQASEIDDFAIQFNADTGSNYVRHLLFGNGSVAEANNQTAQSRIVVGRGTGSSATASVFGVSITDIHDYTSTTKNKTTRTFNGYDLNATGLVYLQSGLWLSTSAITSITLFSTSSSTFQTGTTFALYGMK